MSGAPRQPRNADDLLKWSIAASNAENTGAAQQGLNDAAANSSIQQVAGQIAAGQRPDLADPALYDALMGKSEAQMMREELAVALDETREEQDRIQALDNFEMLIEQIDNANNMTNMKMWQPLVALLEDQNTSAGIQLATLWILGTAVQNNDKAQMAILDFKPLKPILHLLVHSSDGQVRSKALYALSGILKHNAKAVVLFMQEDGFEALRGALLDPDVSLRRKAAFLVNSLLLQDDSASQEASASSSSSLTEPASNLRSNATAVAPMPGSTDEAGRPPMPLEQPPATQLSGFQHPSIAPVLVSSRLLDTLIVSLLPASAQASLPADVLHGIDTAACAGPNGDIELRDDLDYAEKASRACLTFAEKMNEARTAAKQGALGDGAAQIKVLLNALRTELQGKPLDEETLGSGQVTKRWQELGLTQDEVASFDANVQSL